MLTWPRIRTDWWICTFPLKKAPTNFFLLCQGLKIQKLVSKSDYSSGVRPVYRKAKVKHKLGKGMLKMLLSSDSTTNLCIYIILSSPTQTPATLVPAAAPAPSVASFSKSPPSGCGQYYSPPRKYEKIKGHFFGGAGKKYKENGYAHFSSTS